MNDLLKKLNVLVRAGLNDLLDADTTSTRHTTPEKLSPARVEREVKLMRQRVNEALEYEDHLAARVESLRNEVEALDGQADAALAEGQDELARRAVRDLQVAQERLARSEADLQDHRAVTQELMLRVNEMDTAAADLQRAQAAPGDESDRLEQASKVMGDALAQMRERIASFTVTQEPMRDSSDQPRLPIDESEVDDDLARRVERLSKK